jgi:hypothetical protein
LPGEKLAKKQNIAKPMGWYKRVINNCKKATLLIEKRNTQGISPLEQVELRLHLMSCSVCRLYNKQSQLIDKIVRQSYQNSLEANVSLDEDIKRELNKLIDNELKK